MAETESAFTTGNTTVTTEKLRQIAATINTAKMYAKDRTRDLAQQKKELFGSDLPSIAFNAIWRMRKLSDQERKLVADAVADYARHMQRNEFKALENLDADRLEASQDARDAKKTAREMGINTRALDMVLRFESLDEVEREEMFNDIDRYGVALRYW